ncbi:hypothetical protein [Enterococcus cecorum]|uniref:hypothetical protein n=1 Tax=Enterococcus cecorum TaxID=44008 RepID=UPI001FACC05E|nr:hypothetical protein [Enterococcus cecorum]MCJ0522590.1 hypothetical protein [Enterococcus cecorum]MCJ0561013.1 hypothetical protein [Enterococcus cecorum]MCJ0578711.1 hypothetical protein [Enterococcus cecorum]MCJ0583638.1 hypothetical protein [Enterococcus cecorum]MCJ0586052.1 hypothetical protein [Enterococcus cecorum]
MMREEKEKRVRKQKMMENIGIMKELLKDFEDLVIETDILTMLSLYNVKNSFEALEKSVASIKLGEVANE